MKVARERLIEMHISALRAICNSESSWINYDTPLSPALGSASGENSEENEIAINELP